SCTSCSSSGCARAAVTAYAASLRQSTAARSPFTGVWAFRSKRAIASVTASNTPPTTTAQARIASASSRHLSDATISWWPGGRGNAPQRMPMPSRPQNILVVQGGFGPLRGPKPPCTTGKLVGGRCVFAALLQGLQSTQPQRAGGLRYQGIRQARALCEV